MLGLSNDLGAVLLVGAAAIAYILAITWVLGRSQRQRLARDPK